MTLLKIQTTNVLWLEGKIMEREPLFCYDARETIISLCEKTMEKLLTLSTLSTFDQNRLNMFYNMKHPIVTIFVHHLLEFLILRFANKTENIISKIHFLQIGNFCWNKIYQQHFKTEIKLQDPQQDWMQIP